MWSRQLKRSGATAAVTLGLGSWLGAGLAGCGGPTPEETLAQAPEHVVKAPSATARAEEPSSAEGQSPLAGWSYFQLFEVEHTEAGAISEANYQLLVKLDTAALIAAGKMRSDCADVRVAQGDGCTSIPLKYWVASGTCNTTETQIWVKLAAMPKNMKAGIAVHYGNPSASSESDGPAVFPIFFDDFSGTTLDTSKWQELGNGGLTVANGIASGHSAKALQTVANVMQEGETVFGVRTNAQAIGGADIEYGAARVTADTSTTSLHHPYRQWNGVSWLAWNYTNMLLGNGSECYVGPNSTKWTNDPGDASWFITEFFYELNSDGSVYSGIYDKFGQKRTQTAGGGACTPDAALPAYYQFDFSTAEPNPESSLDYAYVRNYTPVDPILRAYPLDPMGDADNDGTANYLESCAGLEVCDGVDNDDDGLIDEGVPDNDQDSVCDLNDDDDDNDGLTDVDEELLGSDPFVADLDGDGVLDYADEDNDNDGIPDSIECSTDTVLPFINGSFESPTGPGLISQDLVPGWKTTASDGLLEFWISEPQGLMAAVGSQFVELNAYEVSTLYQDVDTVPGTSYLYRFFHRGRLQDDTVRFSLGAPGALVSEVEVTTGKDQWQEIFGVVTIPDEQTLTRFAFESLSTYNGDGSIGNFLDGVSFRASCTVDWDEDGIPNNQDLDSDDDGIPDAQEAGYENVNTDGTLPGPVGGNGIPNSAESYDDSGVVPAPADSDGDGLSDVEDLDSDNDSFPDSEDPAPADWRFPDADQDGTFNDQDPDDDNDGLTDIDEIVNNTDLFDPDSDDDGLSDSEEVAIHSDPNRADADGDGVVDHMDIDDDNDGIPDENECSGGLAPLALINGSFEQPLIDPSGVAFLDQADVPGWNTTASDSQIEFWPSGFEGIPSRVGAQFVELNANEISTLYQDVATIPGTAYLYRFYHHGRFGADTMAFELGTPDSMATVEVVTTGTDGWQEVVGVVVIPEGQTVTRFAFESLTGSGAGNLLDGISFYTGCTLDSDGDETVNSEDLDSDNDGIPDVEEAQHGQANEGGVITGPVGENGMPDAAETYPDSGVPNADDNDPDLDEVPNALDLESDGDGITDADEVEAGTNPYRADTDGDGVSDDEDLFPLDPEESTDFDADGTGDNADKDDDNDGTQDRDDAFPHDPTEQTDTDGDEVGNNADKDDDGDDVADGSDAFPLDPEEWSDLDEDGIGDNADPDDDNDTHNDDDDVFPADPAEWADADADGTGNNADTDDDNDSYADDVDQFPVDAAEWQDSDSDGQGNNADPDDDNDAIVDTEDNCPVNANAGQEDVDYDGLGTSCDDAESPWDVAGGGCSCSQSSQDEVPVGAVLGAMLGLMSIALRRKAVSGRRSA